jgi:hypothetical protein
LRWQRVVVVRQSGHVELRRSSKCGTVVFVEIVEFVVSLFLLAKLCSRLYYFLSSKRGPYPGFVF